MSIHQATIKITNLRLGAFIGFDPDGTSKRQEVIINAEIHYYVSVAALRDDIAGALDYRAITQAIIRHVEKGRFRLLERLVNDLVGLCSEHPLVVRALVTVDQPSALQCADSVSLTLEHDQRQSQPMSENVNRFFSRSLRKAS